MADVEKCRDMIDEVLGYSKPEANPVSSTEDDVIDWDAIKRDHVENQKVHLVERF